MPEALKVLIVSQYYWPETFRITEVASSLKEAGADVTVLTGKPNYPEGALFPGYQAFGTVRESHQGIEILRVPMAPRGKRGALKLAWNYLSFVLGASVLGPLLMRGRPVDTILVYGISPILQVIPALVLGRFKGSAVVVWVQDLWPQSLAATGYIRSPLALRVVDWMVRLLYRRSDLLLVQSEAFIDAVAQQADREKIVYHPNPGERSFEEASALHHGSDPVAFGNGFKVVFAGNLGAAQGLDTIVQAAEFLRNYADVRLVLVGSGSRSDWLRQEIARRALTNVMMPGRFPPEAMPDVLAEASALLVTLAPQEIFRMTVPSKVQAYLAAGKPIIAALDGEGARVVVEAGAGRTAPAGDARLLADAILEMSQLGAAERDAMGRAGRAYYDEHFASGRLAARLHELLQNAARARVRRSLERSTEGDRSENEE